MLGRFVGLVDSGEVVDDGGACNKDNEAGDSARETGR